MKELTIQEYRTSEYTIDPVFLNRWSPRSFQEKEVPEEILFSLLDAARWAPSAANNQPWRFMLARTDEEREKFHSFMMEGNLLWCTKAPALVLLMSKKTTDRGPNGTHAFDAGAAWAFLSIEAAKKGLVTHAMGGFYKDQAQEVLGIPDDYELHIVIAIGYQGEKSVLPDALQEREKPSDRLPLEELILKVNVDK